MITPDVQAVPHGPATTARIRPHLVALVGNPNAGKSTVFNALTGLRQKVGNYPGVTVEKKLGQCRVPSGGTTTLLDLPGTYSLESRSPDEDIVRDVLFGLRDDTSRADMVVVIVDASNLERNLYLVTQVMEIGLPMVVVLNMIDTAASFGRPVDADVLQNSLGVPVVPVVARKGRGMDAVRAAIDRFPEEMPTPVPLPESISSEVDLLTAEVERMGGIDGGWARGLALRLLFNDGVVSKASTRWKTDFRPTVEAARTRLTAVTDDLASLEATARYQWISDTARAAMGLPKQARLTATERMDKVLTHRVLGPIIFLGLMAIVFQSIYTWAQWPMNLIDSGIQHLGHLITMVMPAGPLRDLLIDGVLDGVGAVLVFLPQILFLFFFLAVLDDSGYLARAAFLMDKMMSCVGLHGRSFIPLMSSFACAIPGIMATRTIENKRDRFLTILIAPLMSCSARLPVYVLMIGAFIPNRPVWGIFRLPGLTLLSMYLLGITAAMVVGWIFRRTLFKGQPSPFLLELPPYRPPVMRNVVIAMWERSKEFVHRAGTVILAISMILWFLAAYPHHQRLPGESPAVAAGAQVRDSYAGHLGRVIEPVVKPLGFDWKMGIGLIASFAAREVMVSTLATVYNVGNADESSMSLRQALHNERKPDGTPLYTPLVAVTLMVFFVLACQCMSTVAIVRRETNSWKWPLFLIFYMTSMAYVASLITYQVGHALGWG